MTRRARPTASPSIPRPRGNRAGRQATGSEQGLSVADFERQVIRDVREGGATRGYLTGEYI